MNIKKLISYIAVLAAAVSLSGCEIPSVETEKKLKDLLASAQTTIDSLSKSLLLVSTDEVTVSEATSPDVVFSDGDSRKDLDVMPGEKDVVILSLHRTDDLFKRAGTMELLIEDESGASVDLLLKAGSIRLEKNGYDIGIVAPYYVTVKGSKVYVTFYNRWFGETYSPTWMSDSKPISMVATISPFATALHSSKFAMSAAQMGEVESTNEIRAVKGPSIRVGSTPPPTVASMSSRSLMWYEPWDYSFKEVGRFQVACPLTEKEVPCFMDTIRLNTAGTGSVLITDSLSISAQVELLGQANFQYVSFVIPAGMTYEYTIYSTGEGGYLNISEIEFVALMRYTRS
mgnify:CR=1 FL=1